MWFAAKEAVEKKAMAKGLKQGLEQGMKQGLEQGLERGHQEERERIGRSLSQALERRGVVLSEDEIGLILDGKALPPPARPYRRRFRRGGNGG